jgi:hypothetical protein
MRKVWMALAGAVVIAVSVAGVAAAVNTYEVDIAASTPANAKGSAAQPAPVKLAFGFEVGDTEGLRPQVIREYRIAAEGLQSFPDARPTCSFEAANDPSVLEPSGLSQACKRAIVGSGAVDNDAGAPTDRSQKLDCDVRLTLINVSEGRAVDPSRTDEQAQRDRRDDRQIRRRGGIAIRVDTYQPEFTRCPIAVHEAIAAPFYDVRIQGVSTAELRFYVHDTLAHPSGLDNSLTDVSSTIQKKAGRVRVRGERRRVGFYSSVGRKGRTRTVRVTFIDESGVKRTETAQD